MGNEPTELIEALRMKIEALELKNEAYTIKIETLEYRLKQAESTSKNGNGSYKNVIGSNGHAIEGLEEKKPGKKRGRKPKLKNDELANMQEPVYNAVVNMLGGQGFNKATYRAITGVLLCLYENKTATVNTLHEYIGGSKVTIVRHTTLLKRQGLLRYEGSRKKGNYVLTDKGKAFMSSLRAS